MTTAHPAEPLCDVVDFFWLGSEIDERTPERFLILFIGKDDQARQKVLQAIH